MAESGEADLAALRFRDVFCSVARVFCCTVATGTASAAGTVSESGPTDCGETVARPRVVFRFLVRDCCCSSAGEDVKDGARALSESNGEFGDDTGEAAKVASEFEMVLCGWTAFVVLRFRVTFFGGSGCSTFSGFGDGVSDGVGIECAVAMATFSFDLIALCFVPEAALVSIDLSPSIDFAMLCCCGLGAVPVFARFERVLMAGGSSESSGTDISESLRFGGIFEDWQLVRVMVSL
ncbi:hypothetical protein E6O75_ATG05537 [Venturia nashicola]|uniref:Uncharacterized protein n=1 Tax=Venturia nashicola TaxID=86259 RepID=A0A4Z1NXA0_9PEZI|nr:hypothetical protein E6O75_ATG05537 [Venturia nashicola]